MNQNELKAARNSTTVLAALVSTLAHTVHEGKSWVDLHELRRQFSSPENVLCRVYQHLWRVQSIFEGGSKRSCVYMPSLSVRFTQPSHYRTNELACRCRIFPTASPIIKIFSSRPGALRLSSYYWNTGVDTVQLAFLAQKLTSKSAHEPVAQSMGNNDIHYRADCEWVQHYSVTLSLCTPATPTSAIPHSHVWH